MDRNTELLANLRHQRLPERWATGSQAWRDLRAMIPLALVGNFSLEKHIAAIARYDDHGHLPDCLKMGIQDWFRDRDVEHCLKEPGEWPLWLEEYTQALNLPSEHFKKDTPAQIVADAFDERHHLRHPFSQTFVINKPERLQVALLHIEHLPENTALYEHDLKLWVKASPELREKAAPEIGQWYNLAQDEGMLRWHIKNLHSIDATSYDLPMNLTPETGMGP